MNKEKRNAIIAGNWKMNKTPSETTALVNDIKPLVKGAGCKVVLCVPFVDLDAALKASEGTNIEIGAQNCHFEENGAYTGEISAVMLKEMGVKYVIIGHSERRQYFGETDDTVNKRLKAALKQGLKVILCVGETLDEREKGITNEIVSKQTKVALCGLNFKDMENIIIAYEPVWAIGTGRTATSEQAELVCRHIRSVVADLFGQLTAEGVTVQYGGSMKPSNAAELLGKTDVDGGLIGGASLKAKDFAEIVKAAGK